MKQTIRLTESDLRRIIKQVVEESVAESFKRAGRVQGINYNAIQNLRMHGTKHSKTIMDNTEQLRLACLTNEINKELPNFTPLFLETVDKMTYGIYFQFMSVVYWQNRRVVMRGQLSVANREYKQGYIEYDESTEKFYRVRISKNNSITRISKLEIDFSDEQNMKDISTFKDGINEAEAQYAKDENLINTLGPTPQRVHTPYGAYSAKSRNRLGLDKTS